MKKLTPAEETARALAKHKLFPPNEVTDAMVEAGVEYWHENEGGMLLDDLVRGIYLAMNAARLKEPSA